MPGVVVLEGELTGTAGRVSIGGVNNSVWLVADVVLVTSSYPRISRVPFGSDFAVVEHQAHLINSVNNPVLAAPPQQVVGAAVHQGQGLGADVQRQAEGCTHVEESVA